MADKKVTYNGKGIIQGIPARDLSFDEWEALDERTKSLALSSGIYKIDKPAQKAEYKEGEK
jgi:hypothetical protein